jgi:hypothetical protein
MRVDVEIGGFRGAIGGSWPGGNPAPRRESAAPMAPRSGDKSTDTRSGVVEGLVDVADGLGWDAMALVQAVVEGDAVEAFEDEEVRALDLPRCGHILHDDGINGTHTGDLEFR